MLGKYRVERALGEGGMGVVVAARHLDRGELVAIKLLGSDLHGEARGVPDAGERLVLEARASARIKSEHVVKVHEVGRLDTGAPCIVMEHLVGHDLKAHLRERGRLPLPEAIALMLQACDAMAEAHALGIIHRDLKPSNLFVTRRRDGTTCLKVLDFGVAKDVSRGGADLTTSGATVGTPLYMSPEQMLQPQSADTRADIWAMGVVLYEIISGAVPFNGDTLPEIVARVLHGSPEPPSHRCAELPSWIDAVTLRCLAKYPEDRFSTVEQLAATLREGAAPAPMIGAALATKGLILGDQEAVFPAPNAGRRHVRIGRYGTHAQRRHRLAAHSPAGHVDLPFPGLLVRSAAPPSRAA